MAGGQLSTVIRQLRRALDPDGADKPTDAQLLERFLQGRDESAFELLVWRHGGLVLDLCRRLLRHPQDAEDAFQATFLVLVRKGHTIGKRGSVASWLYKVAYRVALEARARSARRAACEQRVPARQPASPETEAAWRELRPLLDEEVGRLPEKYRAPFLLCCVEGQSLEEAARQLGCPRATVGTRVARARERLRQRLIRRGITLSAAGLAAVCAPGPSGAAPPAALVEAVLRAGPAFLAGNPAATGAASASVLALAEAALRPARAVRAWLVVGALLTATVTAGAAGALRGGGKVGTPPAAPAVAAGVPDVLPGLPRGWEASSDHADAFAVGRDLATRHGGRASACVEFRETDPNAFGTLRQSIRAGDYRGKRLRLTAWLRTAGPGRAGLWLRVDGVDLMLALDNMDDRALVGRHGWERHALVLDVSPEASVIHFGVWRRGPGRAWVDDLALDVVGPEVPARNVLSQPSPVAAPAVEPPARPVNLDFEDPTPAPPAPDPGGAWVAFQSREADSGPVLAVTRDDGTVDRYPAAADASLVAYLPDYECGRLKSLALNRADTNRFLTRFGAVPAAGLRRAELVLRAGPSPRPPDRPFAVAVHEVQQPWDEDAVTWKTQPACAAAPAVIATIDPRAAEVRIDVTALARRPGAAGHGWLVKVTRPLPGGPPAAPPAGAGGALLRLLPWAGSVAEARWRARDEDRLVLACVRASLDEESPTPDEELLLATALADPDVLALVRARFVPVRVRYRPWEYQAALRGQPPAEDPLHGLGVTLAETRTPALIVARPDGTAVARLTDLHALDRDAALHFLLGALPDTGPAEGPGDAWDLLAAGRLERARQSFGGRPSRESAYGRSRVASLRGDYERALALALPVAASDGPFRHEARYEAAYARMRLGRLTAARDGFREVLDGPPGPRSADAGYYLGCLLYQAGDVDGARAVWRKLADGPADTPAAARARVRLTRPGLMARSERLTAPASS